MKKKVFIIISIIVLLSIGIMFLIIKNKTIPVEVAANDNINEENEIFDDELEDVTILEESSLETNDNVNQDTVSKETVNQNNSISSSNSTTNTSKATSTSSSSNTSTSNNGSTSNNNNTSTVISSNNTTSSTTQTDTQKEHVIEYKESTKYTNQLKNYINNNPSSLMIERGYTIVVDSSIKSRTNYFTYSAYNIDGYLPNKFGTIKIYVESKFINGVESTDITNVRCYII